MDTFLASILGGNDNRNYPTDQFLSFAQETFGTFANTAQEAFDPQGQGSRGPPPASDKALRQLPTVIVTPEDLVDENNRECCICLEENHLKDRVVRLPCAHIFHQDCIVHWLKNHCTCPVCRYELETDDSQYERERQQRMAVRRPRLHMYELERMSLRELRDLMKQVRLRIPSTTKEKSDLIHELVQSGRIDIIAAPKPVEYKLRDLRKMGVGELKRSMADAGVFFDPIDVVEKEDMVRIFCNSGRLVLLPDSEWEAEQHRKREIERRELVQQMREEAEEEECDRKRAANPNMKTPLVETVSEDDASPRRTLKTATSMFGNTSSEIDGDRGVDTERMAASMSSEMDVDDDETVQAMPNGIHYHQNGQVDNILKNDVKYSNVNELNEINMRGEERVCDAQMSDADENAHQDTSHERIAARNHYQHQSIAALRETARHMSVDLSGCIERSEMVDKLVEASKISEEKFSKWSVSALRALASSVEVDLSGCVDRSEMVQKLVAEAQRRYYVEACLVALMPLAEMSVAELRRTARQWQVNVMDCLEKDEIIQRLAIAVGAHIQ